MPVSQNSTACGNSQSEFPSGEIFDFSNLIARSAIRQVRSTCLVTECAQSVRPRTMPTGWLRHPVPSLGGLPRKEVIQPQLPLRLPCYDFTPVTSPTFDGSLPKGLGHRLRVLLTPMV